MTYIPLTPDKETFDGFVADGAKIGNNLAPITPPSTLRPTEGFLAGSAVAVEGGGLLADLVH